MEGGHDCSKGIVFVGQGSAKEAQHAVAEKLGDGAFVAVDDLGYTAVGTVDDLFSLFGVEFFRQGRGTDDVGEENGDWFAFAFVISRLSPDLLLKCFRRGLLKGGEAR
jgi:hypothetical protein